MPKRMNLFMMVGRLKQVKANLPPAMAVDLINDAIRYVQQERPYWADTIRRGIISLPDAYTTGTVSTTTGSNTITGSGTAWPENDLVATTAPSGVPDVGYQDVTPASMDNITGDTYLLIDPGTPSEETVAVVSTDSLSFNAKFLYTHPTGVVIQASSLSSLQFRLGSNYPIFTVRSITSPTTAELDLPWGGPAVSAAQYRFIKMYVTLSLDFKDFLSVVDQKQGIPLEYHIPLSRANNRDPQRTNAGDPLGLVDLGPNESGNMQYEIWPTSSTARQIFYTFYEGWPELKEWDDLPPWFIDPMLFVDYATARALRTKVNRTDVYYMPDQADVYEVKFAKAMAAAVNADESKRISALQDDPRLGGLGANFWQNHDSDAMMGNF